MHIMKDTSKAFGLTPNTTPFYKLSKKLQPDLVPMQILWPFSMLGMINFLLSLSYQGISDLSYLRHGSSDILPWPTASVGYLNSPCPW